jgi:integrase
MTGSSYYRELQELLEPPVRSSKKLNPILLREEDIRNLITSLWKLDHYSKSLKIKYTTAILFLAYTGQRPDATASKITVEELREAIKKKPPMLWIPEKKDKENFPHWVPIHPILKEWIEKMFKTMDYQVERPFNYDKVKKVFDELNVKAIHTGRKITPSHLRKFFEQMCNNVLMVHPGLRDYIMAHNTGSLNVQSYDGKLPSEIYDQYVSTWRKVNLVPEKISKH